jgi:hypothetical protein
MLHDNSEGRTMLEKALDILDQSSHEDDVNSRIEKNFLCSSSHNTSSDWGNASQNCCLRGSFSGFSGGCAAGADEIPQEI